MKSSDPLAVYIHWPYCSRICPYCDFNVHLDKREGEARALIHSIISDLEFWRGLTGPREISSVHFGGGTPSLLTGPQLETLIRAVQTSWPNTPSELAIEANPNDITDQSLGAWKTAGLNRLSIGVQSFDDTVLKRLGRNHDGASARRTMEAALGIIPDISTDLIFGVAGESEERLDRDLDVLLDLDVPHISTYQLTIEPGTAFAKAEARGESRAVGEDQSATDFDRIHDRLTAAGYHHYEVSNFAKPGFESQHNLAYWRGWDYVGAGPGAHGRLWMNEARIATETALRPADYITSVARHGTGITSREPLTRDEAAEEYVLMGLRIEEGISLERLEQIKGGPVSVEPDLITQGFLTQSEGRLKATAKGRPVLDALTRAVLFSQ